MRAYVRACVRLSENFPWFDLNQIWYAASLGDPKQIELGIVDNRPAPAPRFTAAPRPNHRVFGDYVEFAFIRRIEFTEWLSS